MDAQLIATLPLWFVATLLSLTCHEAAHALVAKWGGDYTAASGGQVSLDPLPHIRREPFGMVVVPIVSFIMNGGGWMIGWASAPYDPFWAARYPRRAALMAAAGPAGNFVLALVAAGGIHIGLATGAFDAPSFIGSLDRVVVTAAGTPSAVTMFLSILYSLNILLGVFNLIPVPPLDGNAVVPLFLNAELTRKWQEFFDDRTFGILGLVAAWLIFQQVAAPVFLFSAQALYPWLTYG